MAYIVESSLKRKFTRQEANIPKATIENLDVEKLIAEKEEYIKMLNEEINLKSEELENKKIQLVNVGLPVIESGIGILDGTTISDTVLDSGEVIPAGDTGSTAQDIVLEEAPEKVAEKVAVVAEEDEEKVSKKNNKK